MFLFHLQLTFDLITIFMWVLAAGKKLVFLICFSNSRMNTFEDNWTPVNQTVLGAVR